MNISRYFLLCATALLAAACGSGSYLPVGPTPKSSSPANGPGGLWFGTLTFDDGPFVEEMVAMSAGDGRFRFLSVDSTVQFRGEVALSGGSFTGDARAFADIGARWRNGSPVVDAAVTGVIAPQKTWSGSWSTDAGESGTFDLRYDPLAARKSDTALFKGIWSVLDEFGNPTATFTMDSDGTFIGQNENGCTSAGRITVIDAKFNLYDVFSEISGCPIAGTYSGLAFVADLIRKNDVAVLALDDDERALIVPLQQ